MASTQELQPTLYELHGDADTQISYSTTSVSGRALLSYAGPHGEHRFEGDDIDVAHTELGGEVTATLRSGPDQSTVTLTVLVPPVRLPAERCADLTTFAVVTEKLSSLAGAPQGQGYRYEPIVLSGEARFVES
jgi:hypothetical protein